MQSNPYMDLQGVSKKGPKGPLRKSFDDCMMFYLLTVFPNNAAGQERYYLTNVLKKPQCISVHQRASVCALCGATQLLHLAAAMLVLKPKCQAQHNSGKCSIHQG
jgi:hypothetical protein